MKPKTQAQIEFIQYAIQCGATARLINSVVYMRMELEAIKSLQTAPQNLVQARMQRTATPRATCGCDSCK